MQPRDCLEPLREGVTARQKDADGGTSQVDANAAGLNLRDEDIRLAGLPGGEVVHLTAQFTRGAASLPACVQRRLDVCAEAAEHDQRLLLGHVL